MSERRSADHSLFHHSLVSSSAAAGAGSRPVTGRETAPVPPSTGWWRQDSRLRSEHFGQRIMCAAFFAILRTTCAAAHTDRADHLVAHDDGQPAFLNGQTELIHADERRNIVKRAVGQHMGGFACEKCGACLVLGGLLIDVSLPVHAVLMNDLSERVQDHDSRRAVMR